MMWAVEDKKRHRRNFVGHRIILHSEQLSLGRLQAVLKHSLKERGKGREFMLGKTGGTKV
jgi:hypothetical protein